MRLLLVIVMICSCGVLLPLRGQEAAPKEAVASTPSAELSGLRQVGDFSRDASGWQSRRWLADGKAETAPLTLRAASDETPAGLLMPLHFPGKQEFVAPVTLADGWLDAAELEFIFAVPQPLPATAMITIFTKDADHLWRQQRRPFPAAQDGIVHISVPIRGREAVSSWESCGHQRPWTVLTARLLSEIGCSFELDSGAADAFEGELILTQLRLLPPQKLEPLRVLSMNYEPRSPLLGKRIEWTLRLSAWPSAPFDLKRSRIVADITTPQGQNEEAFGFYYEDFLYDGEEWDKTKCLTPNGEPSFKIRYCPRVPGEYSVRISGDVDGESFSLPAMAFHARESADPYHGFVRRDPDFDQFFVHDDGKPFWGLGINLRSPFDNRYQQVAPYSQWQDRGLAAYDYLFRKYREHGVNLVEVWMCSWWLALEWINDAPGFHGVGHYNQYRAWMLDHILRLAEENGIYLIIVLNNHGKFGMTYDTEWARNPYNKECGGFLEKCEDYFTDERAHAAFKQSVDYILARWSASPNVFSWKLFTEVDLTGPSLSYYHDPAVAAWHRDMGAYMKEKDLYKHPINTHWMLSYHRINDAIATLPELDAIATDAYYSGGGTAQLINLLRSGRSFAKERKKPLMITEYGGSSYADSMGNLMKQVSIGLWTGFFNEAGIIPMYWWFALVEDKDLYHEYAALSRFGKDEDRRGMECRNYDLAAAVNVNELRANDRLLYWLFDKDYYLSDLENLQPASREQLVLQLPRLAMGDYLVEFWDLQNGEISGRQTLTVGSGEEERQQLQLPPFTKQLALKIKLQTPPQ
jgi:hypothetical protein